LARDDDIDLAGTGRDRSLDLADLERQRRQPGRKPGRYRGDRDAGPLQGGDRRLHEAVIDADGAGGEAALVHAERLEDVDTHRRAGLGTEPADPPGGIVA